MADNARHMTAQMPGRTAAYTVDIAYPSQVLVAQSPLRLQWSAACAGARARPEALTGSFRYCDLGCGDGLTLNLLAASYPAGHFVGIDINAEHIARGRQLAARGGLDNVEFVEASLADLAELALPRFDYVTAFGCYSWVSPDLQQGIHEFAARRLVPGGLFALHYSSLPGASLRDPLSNCLKWIAERLPGNSSERLQTAIASLRELGPQSQFFEQNPRAAGVLDSIAKAHIGAAAHDILNRQPHSLYFAEVHSVATAAGLEFLGSASSMPDDPELMLSKEAYAGLNRLTGDADVVFREAMRDFMLNTSQRYDLYRSPDPERSADSAHGIASLGPLLLHRAGTEGDFDERRRLAQPTAVDLGAPVYATVLDVAKMPGLPISEVLAHEALAGFEPAQTRRAIEQLFALGLLNAIVREPLPAEVVDGHAYRMSPPLNSALLLDTIASPRPEWLASPVLGSPVRLPAGTRLKLFALTGGDLEAAWHSIRTEHPDIRDSQGKAISDYATFRAGVEQGLPPFRQEVVPRLMSIGVVEAIEAP